MPLKPVSRQRPEGSTAPVLFDPQGNQITSEASRQRYDPGEPFPVELPGVSPRARIPNFGQNRNLAPRQAWGKHATPMTPFQQLRALSEFDLVRVAIQDVKGQILGMDWDVFPKEKFKQDDEAKRIAERVRRFIEIPDPIADIDFPSWLDPVLDEVLVTDALCLYPNHSVGGTPLGLEQIDGATIIPLVDDRGRPPAPPAPAFQQEIDGMPEGEWSLLDLWYLPCSRRIDSPYGRSRTEQVLITVNLAIRQQMSDLTFFTDGTLPESLYTFPKDWSPEQIIHYAEGFRSMLAGQDEMRFGNMMFLPEGTYTATKERKWEYQFLEWMARVIAWSFQVSPLPIAKNVNRSEAEVWELSSLESGIRPIARFVAQILNRYIFRVLGYDQVKFAWGDDETEDADTAIARGSAMVGAGAMSPDEWRELNGLEPIADGSGKFPIVATPQGVMQLKEALRVSVLTAESQAAAPPAGFVRNTEDGYYKPKTEWIDKRFVDGELMRWRKVACSRQRSGKKHRAWASKMIGDSVVSKIQTGLMSCTSAEEVRSVFAPFFERAASAAFVKQSAMSFASAVRGTTGSQPPLLDGSSPT